MRAWVESLYGKIQTGGKVWFFTSCFFWFHPERLPSPLSRTFEAYAMKSEGPVRSGRRTEEEWFQFCFGASPL